MSLPSPVRQRRAITSLLGYVAAGSLGASVNALAGYAALMQPSGCVTREGVIGSFLTTSVIAVCWHLSRSAEP